MSFKNITAIILFIIAFFIQSACFAANFQVHDLVLDNSDKTVLIRGKGDFRDSTTGVYVPVPDKSDSLNLINNITTFTLSNPAGYVIDIPNSTLPEGSRYYKLKNSKIVNRIDLLQHDTDIVRVVFTLNNAKDLPNFKTYSDGKNIIVKYNNQLVQNSIQHKFYTLSGDMDKSAVVQNTATDIIFNSNNYKLEIIPKLQNKYYLSLVTQNSEGLILKGIGEISLQKIKYFDNNTRAEIILDSSNIIPTLENKTYNIPGAVKNTKATLAINKLNDKKIKLTILGESLKDYRAVISPDNQSLFISHRSHVLNTSFALNNAKLLSYNLTKNENGYYIFDLNFDKSVAYDIFELNDSYYLDINNLPDFDETALKKLLKNSDLNIQTMKISKDKTRYIIPSKNLNFSYANVESNAKSIKLCFKEKPQAEKINEDAIIIASKEEKIAAAGKIPEEDALSKDKNYKKDESKSGNINVVYVPKEDNSKIIYKEPKKKKPESTTISALKKVVLDPGHGGTDCGAIGGGVVYEKNLNLKVAKMVEEKLKKKNVHVYMTRSEDIFIPLEDRVNYSNEISPDIYVSIHANSTVQNVTYGLEVHYYKDDSLELANTMHAIFSSDKNLKKWDTKDRGVIKSRFYVINHTEAPSVLMEMGFISNPVEREKLMTKQRQEEVATAIVDGILEYLKVK